MLSRRFLLTCIVFGCWSAGLPAAGAVPISGSGANRHGARTDSLTLLKADAESRIREGNLPQALVLYRRAASLATDDIGSRIRLGDLSGWLGDYDRAIVLYRDVLMQDSTSLAGLKGLARVYRWSGRFAEAEKMYETALRFGGEDVEALNGLSVTYAHQHKLDAALKLINRALAAAPGNTDVLRTKGDILAWGNHFAAAEQAYLQALTAAPTSPDVYRSLGDLYRWAGQKMQAVTAYARASELEPRNPVNQLSLAETALDAGNVIQAEAAVRALFAIDPNNVRGYELLKQIDARTGFDAAGLVNRYAKPGFLVISNLIIGYYFWRRRGHLLKRGVPGASIAYRVWPALAGVWVILFAIARATGFWSVDTLTEIAEFCTMALWMAAFITIVWELRSEQQRQPMNVLAIGAHPDDIELGCGGTLARYKEAGYKVYGLVITAGEAGNPYTNERIDRCNEAAEGAAALGLDGLWVCRFPDTRLYSQLREMKDVIEEKIRQTQAAIIITQSPHDVHQDHKAVFEATTIAARGDRTILCYEDVSTDAHFAANYFVDITEYIDDKIRAVQTHRTQRGKSYMDSECIVGRASHRGMQTGVKYAEGFLLYKGVDLWPSY